jgi:hypothetical protein
VKSIDGGKIYTHEITTVPFVKINQPLHPDTFKLAGLNLPDGVYVSGRINPADSTMRKSVGGKLVGLNERPAGPGPLPTPLDEPTDGSRWWLWASIFAFVAIVLTVLIMAKLKQAPQA